MRLVVAAVITLTVVLTSEQTVGLPTFAGAGPMAAATIQAHILGKADTPIGGMPLEAATIELRGLGLRGTTDDRGVASIPNVTVSPDREQPTRADIVVSAEGYGTFTYLSVPIYPNNGPILTPVLTDEPQVDNLGLRPVREPTPQAESSGIGEAAASCSGYSMTDTPPNLVKVFHNNPDHAGDNLIHTVDFHSYVQHVLPQEWIAGWDPEALRAGGMAVKMYGWYHVNNWRGGSANGQCYDVDSTTAYQVWDPNVAYPSTNQAVHDTWDYYLMQSTGTPYQTQYRAGCKPPPAGGCGSYEQCGYLDGSPAPGSIMSAWGSKACDDVGKVWYDILLNVYYFSPASSLKNGPHAVASTAENLPLLVPSTEPSSNSYIRISWGGQTGVTYYRCNSNTYPGLFASCSTIGLGASSVTILISSTDGTTTYYRLRACKSGYCSAINAGGYQYRNVSGNKFYATVGYIWPYAAAHVTTRNTSTSSHRMDLYDGVPGYGGQLEWTCTSVPASANCGPRDWFPDSASNWFATGSQTSGSELFAPVRLIPKSNGE